MAAPAHRRPHRRAARRWSRGGDALGRLDFGTGILAPDDIYRRSRPLGGDPDRLAASLTGTLISLAAAWRIYDLDTACQTLAAQLRTHPGPDAFRTAVHQRTSRWPVPVPAPTLPVPAPSLTTKDGTGARSAASAPLPRSRDEEGLLGRLRRAVSRWRPGGRGQPAVAWARSMTRSAE
jgi:hypothetical protein